MNLILDTFQSLYPVSLGTILLTVVTVSYLLMGVILLSAENSNLQEQIQRVATLESDLNNLVQLADETNFESEQLCQRSNALIASTNEVMAQRKEEFQHCLKPKQAIDMSAAETNGKIIT